MVEKARMIIQADMRVSDSVYIEVGGHLTLVVSLMLWMNVQESTASTRKT